ncbi:acyl-[acyl-carrier-protein] thioesterase [Spirochaeta africana]|uniref:Acyl-ACP thioesterase n=1 Tax=Spirochaeta africana (strain ATCC 700263 / DSM 8902 / Z-7692) TaxID=889378 RepID=H9UJ48_SPIAZ|nr:acyl-ACP thioesterase domain-containing protein [Spirochaeta africana]AFG37541.1 acyl-ACP thioesterase [Spirochaeta africana DSM 8902]
MHRLPFTDNYTLRPNEVDVEHLLRLSSLADMFQNSAWRSADVLGFGFHDLTSQGLAWVLSRMQITLDSYPDWGETVQLDTWPKRTDRLFALRDFELYSQSDKSEPVVRASSAWLLIDLKTRRPRRLESLESAMPSLDRDAIEATPVKLSCPDSMPLHNVVQVRRSNLDMNYHTNNAAYIAWIEDCIPMEMYQHRRIHELTVNFVGESFIGDQLTIEYQLDQNHMNGRICNQKKQDVVLFSAGLSTRT